MNNKYIIYQKTVDKLNEKGFNKFSIKNITKEELKPILIEIYEEFHSFGGMEKSPKEVWKKVCLEIIQEFNDNGTGNVNYNNIDPAFENYNESENKNIIENSKNSQKSDSNE